ncbi:hypothetical protein [Paraburkholderia caballeronis]|uniref:Uncharacterized protein n=1 Tax=Paraburkholderia caballeronis TaxID=416943 RepID=A0A1H7L0C2_9BURK|nr:hypothetical protein [Paraburkholderia caballeronis]PXW28231.1 hypothetical protein C7403_102123 [Paraburkholderia caballeronis]PXX03597.1 hypothetical protein C7407_102123 [Paraburkholderia caballeronis]RAK04341.1 hypothetical protein C7409_102123 [Paraburkholderia caballeronis]SED84110.1 hypothetical protein SAMN05445871_4056 [Paraburkholderia caballeronis]SEK92166.1 hypothetical protein SAMN05192542_104123 [Paraburkholderia caballeronis]
MNIGWIGAGAIAFLWWLVSKTSEDKIAEISKRLDWVEIKCNTNEANILRIFHLLQIERGEISEEEKSAARDELEGQLRQIFERNAHLMKKKR